MYRADSNDDECACIPAYTTVIIQYALGGTVLELVISHFFCCFGYKKDSAGVSVLDCYGSIGRYACPLLIV